MVRKYLVTEDELMSATITPEGELEFTRDNGEKVNAGVVRGADSTVPGPAGKDGSNVLPTQEAIIQELTEDGPVKTQLEATIDEAGDFPGGFITPGVRRAQFAWGCGHKGQWPDGTLDNAHQRLPIILPVETERWYMRIRNANQFGTVVPGQIDFNGVWIGEAARTATGTTGSGDLSGGFVSAPEQALGPFSSPANGDAVLTDWVTDPALQLAPGIAYLISMGWEKAGDFPIQNGAGGMFYSNNKNEAWVQAPTSSLATNVAFSVEIVYEFAGGVRSGIIIGDSLTEGAEAKLNINSFHQRVSRMAGVPIAVSAAYGTRTEQWATQPTTVDAWSRITDADLTLDFAIIALGANDSKGLVSLADYSSRITTIIQRAQSLWGVRDVYPVNIAPRDLEAGPEAIRTSYNDWMATLSRQVFDIEGQLADPANPVILRADSNSGDGTHWTMKGNARAARAFQGARL